MRANEGEEQKRITTQQGKTTYEDPTNTLSTPTAVGVG